MVCQHICELHLQTECLCNICFLFEKKWLLILSQHSTLEACEWPLLSCSCVRFCLFVCVLWALAGSRSSRGYLGERIRAWEGQRGLSFLQNMELRGGELLVPRAGLYYIYGQTYFRLPSTGETDGEEEAQLVQYIYKKVRQETT